jgi:hypothetical protein
MLATDKERLTVYVAPKTDERLRLLALKHRKTLNVSTIVEAMIIHCLDNRHFIEKLTTKKEEIDY